MQLANSFLDTLETPVTEESGSPSPGFRHAGWEARRARVRKALEAADATLRQIDAFDRCGSTYWVLQHVTQPGEYKLAADTCRNRWCVPCQRDRAHVIRANLEKNMPQVRLRFLTLTLRSDGEPLADLLRKLYRSFRRLRSSTIWKDRVQGGIAFLELTRGKDGNRWHPHLHVLLQGKFLPHADVRSLWLKITGDSHVVHIRQIKTAEEVTRYVTKYTTKTASPTIEKDHAALVEAIKTMKGVRTIVPFGTWRSWKLLRRDTDAEWTLYAHESELARRAWEHDQEAAFILSVIDALGRSHGLRFGSVRDHPNTDLPPPADHTEQKPHACCQSPVYVQRALHDWNRPSMW